MIGRNDRKSCGRQASDITHELAHVILTHERAMVILSESIDLSMRTFDQKQEDKANCLAWALLLPRGALFEGSLDLLDTLGVDTTEVRSNDRKLLFEDAGIVTMRPSDVPTYVEHGAADIAERTTDLGNALRERVLRDSHARPIDFQQLILRDHAPCIGRKVPQHGE